jgi:hypothetical protein
MLPFIHGVRSEETARQEVAMDWNKPQPDRSNPNDPPDDPIDDPIDGRTDEPADFAELEDEVDRQQEQNEQSDTLRPGSCSPPSIPQTDQTDQSADQM